LEIFRFLNILDSIHWNDHLFFLPYPKLITSLKKWDSWNVSEATFLNLMEITSFIVLKVETNNNIQCQETLPNISNMSNVKELHLGGVDLKYNSSLSMKLKSLYHLLHYNKCRH